MRCRKCGEMACINMRQHRLSLCGKHYVEWFREQTERFIDKYCMFRPEARVLVAVSGGKDSLSLWDVLHKLGYPTDGIYIHLGIQEDAGYSQQSAELAAAFATSRGLTLHQVHLKRTYGETISEMTLRSQRSRGKPCSICGMVKRYIMNQTGRDGGYDVLVTGHNLDDETAVLLNNTLVWSTDLMRRQEPVLEEAGGFIRKAKPFCRFTEKEVAAYALLSGIEYIEEECPFAANSRTLYLKNILNKLEEADPGAKLRFYLRFLKVRKDGEMLFPVEGELGTYEFVCPACGQPTNKAGLCIFCRMIGSRERK